MEFITLDISEMIPRLDKLTENTSPQWGSMSAQRMVEHLSDSLKISSGKIKLAIEVEEEKIERMIQFLNSEKEMPKNFEVSFAKKDTPLRHEEIELAIDEFLLEWIDFEEFFDENPEKTTIHPLYGPLNYDQWCRMHSKHITHHFQQFEI